MTEYKCGSAKQCQFGDMCKPKYDIGGCSHYKEKRTQTNEEWIHTLNTEQLAEFLADKCNEVVETVLSDASCGIGDIDNDDYWYRRKDFVEWLKQPHTKE